MLHPVYCEGFNTEQFSDLRDVLRRSGNDDMRAKWASHTTTEGLLTVRSSSPHIGLAAKPSSNLNRRISGGVMDVQSFLDDATDGLDLNFEANVYTFGSGYEHAGISSQLGSSVQGQLAAHSRDLREIQTLVEEVVLLKCSRIVLNGVLTESPPKVLDDLLGESSCAVD